MQRYRRLPRPVVSFLLGTFVVVALPLRSVTPGTCDGIRDPDRRHLCRALTGGSTLPCSSIRDSDLRHYCRGVVGPSRLPCESIRDGDLRRRCREGV
jgi:hypothetical protein